MLASNVKTPSTAALAIAVRAADYPFPSKRATMPTPIQATSAVAPGHESSDARRSRASLVATDDGLEKSGSENRLPSGARAIISAWGIHHSA